MYVALTKSFTPQLPYPKPTRVKRISFQTESVLALPISTFAYESGHEVSMGQQAVLIKKSYNVLQKGCINFSLALSRRGAAI